MNLIKNNKGLISIVVLILVFLFLYANTQNTPATSGSTTITVTNTDTGERKMLQLLSDMKNIRLDGKIFESDVYISLQDFSRQVISEPVGRQDPFAPLEDTSVQISGGEDLADQVLLR